MRHYYGLCSLRKASPAFSFCSFLASFDLFFSFFRWYSDFLVLGMSTGKVSSTRLVHCAFECLLLYVSFDDTI